MAAPLKNQNHLKYSQKKVKQLFTKAVKVLQENEQLFNYPSLHQALNLKTLRTLPYLAEKHKHNQELMQLWDNVKKGLDENLQKRISKIIWITL